MICSDFSRCKKFSFIEVDGKVVSHIYTYDRAQNILNFVQPLQNLIL